MNKLLLRKIRLAALLGWKSSAIARYFNISNYRVLFWLGKLKRRPKKDLTPIEEVMYESDIKEFDKEELLQAEVIKKSFNNSILSGKLNLDNPVEAAQNLRKKFKRICRIFPEEINTDLKIK